MPPLGLYFCTKNISTENDNFVIETLSHTGRTLCLTVLASSSNSGGKAFEVAGLPPASTGGLSNPM